MEPVKIPKIVIEVKHKKTQTKETQTHTHTHNHRCSSPHVKHNSESMNVFRILKILLLNIAYSFS